jgi:uncharacterized membrane protein (DUF106 family)
MLKITAAAALVALFSVTPALAMDKLSCDDDSMKKVEMMMKDMADKKTNVEMAMKENDMAMMSKKEGKVEDCAMHLNMAQEEMMK